MTDRDAPPDIVELAEAVRTYAQRTVGVRPDYSSETLPIVDEYVRIARTGVVERPETLPLVARSLGAYFGEVVRRFVGGFWRNVTADEHDWEVCAHAAYLALNPVGVAHEVLAQSAEHSGPSGALRLAPEERDEVEQRLARLPPVGDNEYYLLSTRLEVVEVAYEALRELMGAGGTHDVRFDPSDYE